MKAPDWRSEEREIGPELIVPCRGPQRRSRASEHGDPLHGNDEECVSQLTLEPSEELNECNSEASLEPHGRSAGSTAAGRKRNKRRTRNPKAPTGDGNDQQRYGSGPQQQAKEQREQGPPHSQPHSGTLPFRGQYPYAQPGAYFGHPHPHQLPAALPHAHHNAAPPHPSSFPGGPPLPSPAYPHPPQQWPMGQVPVPSPAAHYLPAAGPPFHPAAFPQHRHAGGHPHPPPQLYGHSHPHFLSHGAAAAQPVPHPHYAAAPPVVDSRVHHAGPAAGPVVAGPADGLAGVEGAGKPQPADPHSVMGLPQADAAPKDDSDNDKSASYHRTVSDRARNHIHRCPSNQAPDPRSSTLSQATSTLSTTASTISNASNTSSYSSTKPKPNKKRKYQSRRPSPSHDDDSDNEQEQSLKVQDRRERKNTQSRARAAKLKERIQTIQSKHLSQCNEEELATLALYEERRQRKNGRSRERAMERKEEMERIMAIPEDQWTEKDKEFVGETMMAKFRKNEGDRLRRKKIKIMNASDGNASEKSKSDTESIKSTSNARKNSDLINFNKALSTTILTNTPNTPNALNVKIEQDSSTLNISPHKRAPIIPLLGSNNNLFKNHHETLPRAPRCKNENTQNRTSDNHHQSRNNHNHQNSLLPHNHTTTPLTPVQTDRVSSPLDISPPGSNVSQLFATSPVAFSHVIQSSPPRMTSEHDNDEKDGLDINLEHATPNSTGFMLGSLLTPSNNAPTTPAPSDANNNNNVVDSCGSERSVNILRSTNDYTWAAPIMVPTSMSTSSCLGSISSKHNSQSNQRTMPQLTSPIRTSPLNLPRRDRSLLLASSPRVCRSYSRSGSPILRVLRKPLDEGADKAVVSVNSQIHDSDGVFEKDIGHECESDSAEDHDSHDQAYHHSNNHCHQHHLGLRMTHNRPDHRATEPITVSFSGETA